MLADQLLYNIDFEICCLAMLLLVLANIPIRNMLHTLSNRIFMAFLACGVFDVAFDIVSAVTMSYPHIYPRWVIWGTLQSYYLLQITMPALLLYYVLSLHRAQGRRVLLRLIPSWLMYGCMVVLVASNPVTGLISYFAADGSYHRGPLHLLTYLYTVVIVGMALANATRYRAFLARRSFLSIWQYAAINGAMMLLQFVFPHMLLTGVGISTSLIVLLITANNPLSKIDALTGLYDAAALREVLRDRQRRAHVYPVVVAMDNIKRINLVFGFEAGNRVLRGCADRLKDIGGPENTFRLQGDTFLVLTHNEQDYRTALTRVRAMFQTPWDVEQAQVHLSAAVCGVPDPGRHPEDTGLVDYIDYMLGRAKAQGAGAFLEDNDALSAQYLRNKQIEAYLYTAIRQNLFEVYLQPIYSLSRKRFVSAEALVRLRHPEYGMISPSEFIPIAERSGEIAHVERTIFCKLCEFLQANPVVTERLENVKFNLSPASFLSAEPSRYLLAEIKKRGLDAYFFQFEITETAATVYDDALLSWADTIKAAGAGLCLDDFGSGYANLSAVMKLPFDVVKMDRSLLVDAGQNEQAAILYGKLVNALSGLGYCVLAEGAETAAEVEFLHSVGVRHIQGFYYAHPLPPEAFLQFLEAMPPLGAAPPKPVEQAKPGPALP